MKNSKIIYFFLLIFILFSCKKINDISLKTNDKLNESNSAVENKDFPAEKSISEYKTTDFVYALEKDFPKNKNTVYAPTILFAWQDLKKELVSENLVSDEKNKDFELLNSSKSYQNSLNVDEFENTITNNSDGIEITSYFKKLLPFVTEFQKIDSLKFKKSFVKGFGITYFDEDLVHQIKIIYYKDNTNFIVKLLPKDQNNEIILIKTNQNFKNFSEVLKDFLVKEKLGLENRKDSIKSWKNEFTGDDELQIPKIGFNINKGFGEFTNLNFKDYFKKPHILNSIAQRNAFVLDETGAKAESEATVSTDSASVEDKLDLPKPKRLFFNDNFYIFLKKKTSKNPYFALKLIDTELMNKN